jgi:hypothetical protein
VAVAATEDDEAVAVIWVGSIHMTPPKFNLEKATHHLSESLTLATAQANAGASVAHGSAAGASVGAGVRGAGVGAGVSGNGGAGTGVDFSHVGAAAALARPSRYILGGDFNASQ